MSFGYSSTTTSFSEINSHDFRQQLTEQITAELSRQTKDYILSIDEEEYKNYLIDKYSLEPLQIDYANEMILEPKVNKQMREDSFYREQYEAEVYLFTIKYNFTGSSVLFKVRPDTWTMTNTELSIDSTNNTVSFQFNLYKKDPSEFLRAKEDFFKRAFTNLERTNAVAQSWNNNLPTMVSSMFQTHKKKYQSENVFFAAINVKVNSNTSSVFTTPTIKKKIIPQPSVSKHKEFSSEPMMSNEMYNDALKVIYDSGKNMEKKPALYKGKDEEGLRDQFLFVLETRYDAITATGETFNRGGKTDIILKYANDGSNLFVAECKFWRGGAEFLKAISQLFDRYLTWRDSKAALIIFVTNKDFTNVLKTIKSEIKSHPYFVKEVGIRGESSFSYLFHLPQDIDKKVYFEVLAFHYDK